MDLAWRLVVLNRRIMAIQLALAVVSAGLFYVPALFLRRLLEYLQADDSGTNKAWGWFCSAGLFVSTAFMHIGRFTVRRSRLVLRLCSHGSTLELEHDDVPGSPEGPCAIPRSIMFVLFLTMLKGPAQLDPIREDPRAEGRGILGARSEGQRERCEAR
jgi:hypothetical protein